MAGPNQILTRLRRMDDSWGLFYALEMGQSLQNSPDRNGYLRLRRNNSGGWDQAKLLGTALSFYITTSSF